MEDQSVQYIFGDRIFIGYPKFYKGDRDFGFIVSNNVGMKTRKEFWYKYKDFYVDASSFDENIRFNMLVVFRPAYVNGRLKALNVRQFDSNIHKSMAIETILENNIIRIDERERATFPAGRSGVTYGYIFSSYEINIYKLSGVKSYELIEKCWDLYESDGSNAFLKGIDNFISTVGGERAYYYKLKEDYTKSGKESEIISKIFTTIDSTTATNTILSHPSFQLLAPYELLKKLVGKLNEDYYIPAELSSEHCRRKLQEIINDNKVFNEFYAAERDKVHSPIKRNRLLRLLRKIPETDRESLNLKIKGQIKERLEGIIDELDNMGFQEKHEILEFFNDYLNDEQKNYILKSMI